MTAPSRQPRGAGTGPRVAVVISLLLLHPPRAPAEPAAANAPSELARAKYDLAVKAHQGRRFSEAVLLLEESLRVHSSPNARVLLAQSYRELGRLGSAHKVYQAAAKEAAERVHAGQKQYDEARKFAVLEMAELEPRVPRLTLAVPADVPFDFVLTLDGLPVAKELWGATQLLDPGKHEVTATGTKMRKFTQTLELRVGEQSRVDVSPEHEASAVVRLSLPERSRPKGMTVYVDGQASTANLDQPLYLEPGPHALLINAPGYRSFQWQRQLDNGDHVQLRPTLRRASPRWATFVTGGLTLATLGSAIGLGVKAQLDDNENRPLASSPDLQPLDKLATRDRIRAMAGASTGLGVLAGVFGAATLACALTADWRRPRPTKPQVAMLATDQGAYLMSWGEF